MTIEQIDVERVAAEIYRRANLPMDVLATIAMFHRDRMEYRCRLYNHEQLDLGELTDRVCDYFIEQSRNS